MSNILIGITGASGQTYASRIIQILRAEIPLTHTDLIYTDTAKIVWRDEMGSDPLPSIDNHSYYHKYASGSNSADTMIIIPCTMGTIGRIANGTGGDLIARAADVMLKERKPLVIVPRETPFNLIHLENLTRLAKAGAIIAPASPSFYTHPTNLDQLIDNFARRILHIAGIHQLPTNNKYIPRIN
ncbi:putative UbiX-like flavin prenyltransferase [bioreactor metagenome]|uniref:Putative UbiX-like flavin prenyltransferase n=1 Tax=bioreactor metagenome TaxID=1076179 RepID=A0A645B524_9ZZZZ|nr:UbiX family flavin prenyltransferase [Rikenellaceae bacterium]